MIYIYMEMSQWSTLNSYIKQTKMSLLFFFCYRNREQEGKTGPVWGHGTSGKGRM
jgi:hypothetical protein